MKTKRDYKSEVLDIVKTKDWDRAKKSDKNLYQYVCRYRDTDENCKTIWEHIKTENRDFESEISEIVETKDWNRARQCNDKSLYQYICRYKDTDEDCRTIWEHMSHQNKDFESEVLEIIRTKDWDRARCSNDRSLYRYIKHYKDTDKNCKIIWDHIKTHHTIKDYLQYYFEQGKPKSHNTLFQWFNREINKSNQCCIDIKNLIVAANTYQDPVALETLGLIKNHLEREGA